MTQNTDMRIESGTCNVCSAPCSSCMHLNHALTGSKAEEFSDENCRIGAAIDQYSMDEDNAYSLRSRACESNTVSEASNMQSVNSSHDALSENAKSRQIIPNKYQDSKHLEGHDDNTSCISRASDTNSVNVSHQKNEERIIMHVERDSCSRVSEKLSECTIENFSSSCTKEREPVVSGEKCIVVKDGLIESTSNISLKVCPKLEADTEVCEANNEDPKCSVQDGQCEKAAQLVKVCDICGDAGREDLLAICSRCSDGAEHTYCMREMLEKVPEGDWLCEECKDAEENENKKPDVEDKKIVEVSSTSQVSGKRLSDNIEVAPAAKRQALESSTGSPKTSSPKRLVPLSRESSFKTLNKSKVKTGLPIPSRNNSGGSDTETARSPSIGPRGQTPKGTLLKSNSFNNVNSKPRVKLVDEVVPPKSKGDLKGSRHLKESGALDRKFPSRIDRPVVSSVVSSPKGDQRLTPRAESSKPSAMNNNREVKVIQDGKASALSRSMSSINRKSLEPQIISERTSTRVDEAQQDVLPRTRETANQIEKSRDSSSDRVRPVVPTSSKGPFCQKCKEFGHAIECCTAGTTQESGAEISVTTSSSSKEEMHKGNILKAAIQAALLRRPEIYKKKEVSNQTDEVSTSGTDLNCEVTSNDPILVSSTPKNSMSVEETPEQQEILENSTSDSSKCSSANDFKQLKSCPTDFRSQPGKLGSICLAAGKPVVRDMSDKAMTLSILPSKTLAFPEYEYIWQGIFEVHRNGKPPDLYTGLQAHLSSCASPKVLGAVNKFLPKVSFNEASRTSLWPSQFHHGGVSEDNIALYFFASDVERHGLLDRMIRNDLALKGNFEDVELLIFPSNQLPENSQRWNMLFFLWGIFRGRKMNHSDSTKKICIPSLNGMPVEEKSSSVVSMVPETHCLPKCKDEETVDRYRACNALVLSTSTDQHPTTRCRNVDVNDQRHLDLQVNIEKLDGRIGSKWVPTSTTLLCQDMNSTDSSLKASVAEQGQCKDSKPPEAMGKSASSSIVETKTDSDVFVKEEKTLSVIPSEEAAACNITKDTISEKINTDEDQQRPKERQKGHRHYNIDLEANIDDEETGYASDLSKDKNSITSIGSEDKKGPMGKQKNDHYIDLEVTLEEEGTDFVNNICEDKISEKMDVEEDGLFPKRKRKDDHYIDLEATFQGDPSAEGINCQIPNDKVKHVDLSDTIMQGSSVSCQKMPWTQGNVKLEHTESSDKKLKTCFSGIYGSGGRDSFNDSITSLGNDLGSGSSVEDKGCVEACDEKIIREDLGTMERTFFPVGTHNISNSVSVLNSLSTKGVVGEYDKGFQDGIPNLELALGGKTKALPTPSAPKGMLPFLVGPVERQNNRPESLGEVQEDDGVAASLSLSLSFPSPNKEHIKPAELLPDGQRMNNSFFLFGRK
ncbi:hypothetical protein ACSQ67_002886 [Phaseolus vulgaris]